MKNFFNNYSIIVTAEWKEKFPLFVNNVQGKANNYPEIILCNSHNLIGLLDKYSEISVVYVVNPKCCLHDPRYVGELFLLPVFEPSNSYELYHMLAFSVLFSKKFNISVLIVAPEHFAEQAYDLKENIEAISHLINSMNFPLDYSSLNFLEKMKSLETFSSDSPFNEFNQGHDKTLGIIVSGSVSMEFDQIPSLAYPVLKVRHYPIGRSLVESIYYACDEILVLEEGRPYIEQHLKGIMGVGTRIRGKLNQIVPINKKITSKEICNILNL
ncbi:MAG: hypothetical protein N2662_08425 [Bacteroidales bacterium]|nr:hypothetical protein [Bacteroidales bacterium]